MIKRVCSIGLSLIAAGLVGTVQAQENLSTKTNSFQPQPASVSSSVADNDRVRDGLLGPVRRIKTEIAKLTSSGGKLVEDKRVVLESSAYDIKGHKTENSYFPVAGGTLTGRELYKYDDKGNISEMTLHSTDGSLVSKEVYKYEFDFAGNWTKMTTAVAVVDGGKASFEPTEVTYRTIMYYLDENMAKMLQPGQPAPTGSGSASPSSSAPVSEAKSIPVDPSPVVNKPAETNKVAGAVPNAVSINKSKLAISPTSDAGSSIGVKRALVEAGGEPPANATPKPLMKPVSGGVLNGSAITLPAPSYPDVARRMRASGTVVVEVIIDENGKVISAQAVSGNTLLRDVAVQAANRARFSPSKLSGQPVKVAGIINYHFNLPN
ncbi:MAG: TonB family protein [Pyrinomonadaceae bacterium]